MISENFDNDVPNLKKIFFGKTYFACFIEAYEVYFTNNLGGRARGMYYFEEADAAKKYINQADEKNKPFLKRRKVVLLKVGPEYLLLEDYSSVKIKDPRAEEEKTLESIKSKLTQEEIDFLFTTFRQGLE